MAQNSQQHQPPDLFPGYGSISRTQQAGESGMKGRGGYLSNDNSAHRSYSQGNYGLGAMPNMVSIAERFGSPSPGGTSTHAKTKYTTDLQNKVDTGQGLTFFGPNDTSATRNVSNPTEVQYVEQQDSLIRPDAPSFVPLAAPVSVRRSQLCAENKDSLIVNAAPETRRVSSHSNESKIHPIDAPYDSSSKLIDHDMLARLSILQINNAAELHTALISAHGARQAKKFANDDARSEILSLLLTAREKEHQLETNKHVLYNRFVQKMSMAYSRGGEDEIKESARLEAVQLLKAATNVSLRVTDYRKAIENFRDQLLHLDNDRISTATGFANTMFELVTKALGDDDMISHTHSLNSMECAQEKVGLEASTMSLRKAKANKKSQRVFQDSNHKVYTEEITKTSVKMPSLMQSTKSKISNGNLDHTGTKNKVENGITMLPTDQAHQQKNQKKNKSKNKKKCIGKGAVVDLDASLTVASNVDSTSPEIQESA